MEDDNSLELSLGLACGGSLSKQKVGTLDPNVVEGNKSKVTVGNLNVTEASFEGFFSTSVDNQNHATQQRNENFWKTLGNRSSQEKEGLKYHEIWSSGNKIIDVEDDNVGSSKRKMPFEDMTLQKKPEKGCDFIEVHDKSPNNVRISINTDDGSSAENEGVAESEAEGPPSWLMSRHEEYKNSSDAPNLNDKPVFSNSDLLISNQHRSLVSKDNVLHGRSTYGPQSSTSTDTTGVPVSIEFENVPGVHNRAVFPSPVMQLMPLSNDKQSSAHLSSNLQIAFGYPSVQLPTLESSTSWMMGPRTQSGPRSTTSDGMPKAYPGVAVQAHNSSAPGASAFEGNLLDLTKGTGEDVEEVVQHDTTQREDEGNANKILRRNEIPNLTAIEGKLLEHSTIRPGVDPGLKFGGSGSCPDLPWVSTTGPGPNGKTISGVTYKYSQNQIKIVCACHGTHMTPEEFIQHANADALDTENSTGVASYPSSNAAASAQS